ncbi:hypothetical protein NQ317_011893 [Molorchus minor]|uniref:C2H2-type domain-containing protein n=1 Tax=Molorchus minor TaxID=1323400 RepID=A0ABQ9JUT4_9CUCU|nr:hypothetical protein NQ317_011893 [Molorchus minor]
MNTSNINYQDFPKICRICLRGGDFQHNFVKEKINELEDVSSFIEKCKNSDTYLRQIYVLVEKREYDSDECGNDSDSNKFGESQNETQTVKSNSDSENNGLSSESVKKHVTINKTLESKKCRSKTCQICRENIGIGGWKKNIINIMPMDCRCPICDKPFYPRYRLTIHLKSHRRNTPYECPKCSKMFVFAEDLRKHVLTHKGVKPFVCSICKKGFLRKRSLDEHMNFHTGETPYICIYCGEGFKRLADHLAHAYHSHNKSTEDVPKHKRKYTEKRVHLNLKCKICEKVFASRSVNTGIGITGIKRLDASAHRTSTKPLLELSIS